MSTLSKAVILGTACAIGALAENECADIENAQEALTYTCELDEEGKKHLKLTQATFVVKPATKADGKDAKWDKQPEADLADKADFSLPAETSKKAESAKVKDIFQQDAEITKNTICSKKDDKITLKVEKKVHPKAKDEGYEQEAKKVTITCEAAAGGCHPGILWGSVAAVVVIGGVAAYFLLANKGGDDGGDEDEEDDGEGEEE